MTDQVGDCIFCKIAAGELGTGFIVETENVVAFDDISPQARAHVQVIPRRHVESVHGLSDADAALWVEMLSVVQEVAERKGIAASGYRIVSNVGPDSGQEVQHLHVHVLGGQKLGPIG